MRRRKSQTATVVEVAEVMRTLRIGAVRLETRIHARIEGILTACGWGYVHEFSIGPRSRVDFLVAGGVVLEVKAGKPNSGRVRDQLARYAAHVAVTGIVLIVERNIFRLPTELEGKPIEYVSLSANWGVAL